jgi:amidase
MASGRLAPTVAPMTSETSSDLAFTGVAHQAELVRSGAVTARALVAASLERIGRLDPSLNAFRVVRAERALAEAGAAQARVDAGEAAPLLGVPIAVKDNMDVAGELTTHGTGIVDEAATQDAEVVRRLRAAGAIVVGKTNMPELALWPQLTDSQAWGATRNPWDPARTTGGSSGGSAAAVAAGMVAGALGSDGGGSIRIPSAACGLFGLKPQRGRVPLVPDDDHWLGLTCFGPMTRTVADAALLLDVVADGEHDFARAAATAPARLRIAVSTKPTLPAKPKAAAREAVASTADLLRSLGHVVRERDPDHGQVQPLFGPRYARGAWLDAQRLERRAELEKRTRGIVRVGGRMERMAARARAKEAARAARINAIFDEHDVLMTPVTAAQPLPVGRFDGAGAARTFLGAGEFACYTAVWNVTGQPAAAVPAGFDADGMPMAVQLVAPPDGEATLFALAAQIEQARPWAHRRPLVG